MANFEAESKTFAEAFNYTRTNPATYKSPNGLVLTVADGVPRFGQDGFTVEEGRTNELVRNRDLTAAEWSNAGLAVVIDQVGVDGVANTAARMTDSTSSATSIYQTFSISTVDRYYAASVFVKKTEGATVFPALRLQFSGGTASSPTYTLNTNDGTTIKDPAQDAAEAVTVEDYGEFWRLGLVARNTGLNNDVWFRLYCVYSDSSGVPDGNLTGEHTFDMPQFEQDTDWVSSPVETGQFVVTRGRDYPRQLTMDDAWAGGDFTLYGEFSGAILDSTNATYISLTTGSSSYRLELRQDATNNYLEVGVNMGPAYDTITFNETDHTTGQAIKWSLSYDSATGKIYGCVNGEYREHNNVVTDMQFDRLHINQRYGVGYIPAIAIHRNVAFVNRRWSQGECEAWGA